MTQSPDLQLPTCQIWVRWVRVIAVFFEDEKSPRFHGGQAGRGFLCATNTYILKSHGPHAGAIQKVLGVHNHRTADNAADAVKIKCPEFRPSGAQYQRVCAFSNRVS